MKDPKQKVPYAIDMLFPQPWLNAEAEGDPQHRTNREIQTEVSRVLLSSILDGTNKPLFRNITEG